MTKTERNQLASIVARMLYNIDSDAQSLGAAREIMESFPSISNDVKEHAAGVAIRNIEVIISGALLRKAGFNISGTDNTVYYTVGPLLNDIVTDYAFQFKEWNQHVLLLESQLRDAGSALRSDNAVWTVVSEIVKSPEWEEVVADYYSSDSLEYTYLIPKSH